MSFPLGGQQRRQKLLFFLAQDVDSRLRQLVHSEILRLTSIRKWTCGAPSFVDETTGVAAGEDLPVETVGGVMEIYSALPPFKIPLSLDAANLEDVKALVRELANLSRREHLSFEFELDGNFVGAVDDGEVDRSMQEGLLGSWERRLMECGADTTQT